MSETVDSLYSQFETFLFIKAYGIKSSRPMYMRFKIINTLLVLLFMWEPFLRYDYIIDSIFIYLVYLFIVYFRYVLDFEAVIFLYLFLINGIYILIYVLQDEL